MTRTELFQKSYTLLPNDTHTLNIYDYFGLNIILIIINFNILRKFSDVIESEYWKELKNKNKKLIVDIYKRSHFKIIDTI